MSTILDALKKVERQRESPREQVLHAPAGAPERRRSSISLIAACAVVGLTSGIGLALWRNDRAAEVAALPELAPPAAIDVPPAPAPPEQVALAKPEGAPADARDKSDAVNPQAQQAQPPLAAAPPSVAVLPPSESAPAAPPVAAAPPASGSVLEPSPFTPPRVEGDTRLANVPASTKPGVPAVAAVRPVPAPPVAEMQPPSEAAPPEAVAAVPPPEPEAAIPPVEAEPPPAPPTVLDTGRAPPGLPRFALSFLQWSEDPARRFAFVSIDGGPSQRVREGDMAGGCLVAEITPAGVQFKRDDKIFTIRPRH